MSLIKLKRWDIERQINQDHLDMLCIVLKKYENAIMQLQTLQSEKEIKELLQILPKYAKILGLKVESSKELKRVYVGENKLLKTKILTHA